MANCPIKRWSLFSGDACVNKFGDDLSFGLALAHPLAHKAYDLGDTFGFQGTTSAAE